MTTWSDHHWGDGEEDCPICSGIGHIRYDVPENHPYFGRMFRCKCRWPHIAETWQRLSGMTSAEADYTFSGLIIQDPTLGDAIAEARAFSDHSRGGMITFLGLYGTAKSHLGFTLVNEALLRGTPAALINAEIMLNHIRDGYKGDDDGAAAWLTMFTEEARLLVIDEIQRINPTVWGIRYMFEILDRRYRLALAGSHKTVICANTRRDERGYPIFEWDDGAIASRLMQFPIVEISQPDARPALAQKTYQRE